MRILFITHAFNSLSQRLFVTLQEHGHEVSVEFDINDDISKEAVELFHPDLIIAPFLKRAIAEEIWINYPCLIVHPGIPGDRGPSALDWAILKQETYWGVTVLQANAEMDGGKIWSSAGFPMREASKASLYRNEVAEAAVSAVLKALENYQQKGFKPASQDYSNPAIKGRRQPMMKQADRAIDWQHDDTNTVLRKIRSADGFPGLADTIAGRELYLYDAREEKSQHGLAGELIARSGPAVCRATIDGAVWIGHLRDRNSEHSFKLPAVQVLFDEAEALPEIVADGKTGYQEICYEEAGQVGYLWFSFYNGAMSTEQCQLLRAAYIEAKQRDTRMIVLMGGADFWSNGMHLNIIEAADSAADESWRNINAINDLAREIINTRKQLTVAVLQGNAGAGGVFLARAADEVWARDSVLLNPHYKDMGNLYGSEYWSYLLPRYSGQENAQRITQARLPIGVKEAAALALVDEVITPGRNDFCTEIKNRALLMSRAPAFASRLKFKNARRLSDESIKPLAQYRKEELEKMKLNFYGFDPSYHVARYNFVYKIPKSRTPVTIAMHRNRQNNMRKAS